MALWASTWTPGTAIVAVARQDAGARPAVVGTTGRATGEASVVVESALDERVSAVPRVHSGVPTCLNSPTLHRTALQEDTELMFMVASTKT